jgi:SAM-dependent methyltransferase
MKETNMDRANDAADEQAARWNGVAGRAWVEAQEVLDRMYEPLEKRLVEAVAAASARRVLDVGCGAGGTTLAVARLLGTTGQCVGIDISEPMIATARARAEREGSPARFIRANAQDHAFEPGSFDMIVSRFGVMFFDDFVGAFANLRRAAQDGGQLWFIAWRSASENPFMTTAERAAAPILPNIPPRRPDGPGQFALADEGRLRHTLGESGWAEIDVRPLDVSCTFPEKELIRYLTRLGPLGLILHEADDKTRARVVETVRPAFDPYVHGAEVRFTAACWTVGARGSALPHGGQRRA